MKCDDCYFRCYHPPGSFQSVAEGGDDPYSYEYCAKGHWQDAGSYDEQCAKDINNNFWNDCKDYRQNIEPETHHTTLKVQKSKLTQKGKR